MTSVLTILRILSDLVISFPQRIMSDKKKITLDHFSRPCTDTTYRYQAISNNNNPSVSQLSTEWSKLAF